MLVRVVFGEIRSEMTLLFEDAGRFPAHITLHMHSHPTARNRRRGRRTGEVCVHVPHRRHDVLQREFAISEAGVPHKLVIWRKSSEDLVAEVAVGELLPI